MIIVDRYITGGEIRNRPVREGEEHFSEIILEGGMDLNAMDGGGGRGLALSCRERWVAPSIKVDRPEGREVGRLVSKKEGSKECKGGSKIR